MALHRPEIFLSSWMSPVVELYQQQNAKQFFRYLQLLFLSNYLLEDAGRLLKTLASLQFGSKFQLAVPRSHGRNVLASTATRMC